MSIPKLKKKVSDFFVGEEGSISKDKLLKTGIIIAGVAMSAGIAMGSFSQHKNVDCPNNPGKNGDTPTTHGNVIKLSQSITSSVDGSHCNGHSSHSSHGSHCSCECSGWN